MVTRAKAKIEAENWAVICLGIEPKVYGPFASELASRTFVYNHTRRSKRLKTVLCRNGIEIMDHHIEPMERDGMATT